MSETIGNSELGINYATIDSPNNLITVKSGFILSSGEIQKKMQIGNFKGFVNGLNEALFLWEPSIAKKFGDMRRYVILSIASQLNGQFGRPLLSVDIVRAIEQLGRYFSFHLRQSGQFNPNFAGGYSNPTTDNTHPMDISELKAIAIPLIKDKITQEMRLLGLGVN